MKSVFLSIFIICANIVYADDSYDQIKNDLATANEAQLAKLPKNSEIYRLYWNRSFDETLIYRVDLTDPKNSTITITKLSNKTPKSIIKQTTTILNSIQIENVNRFLNGAQFWDLPSQDPKSLGFDGATWLLEGIKKGKYHYTERWSPLPPYFGWVATPDGGEKRLEPPFEQQVKHSDEIGLDFLCLYIMLMVNPEPEVIY
ncbi:MAG: hypothetical protein KDC92_16185 [Bacteroidetes bacterium]|nr:hypothetical protein [Bacteroidota bacterium]